MASKLKPYFIAIHDALHGGADEVVVDRNGIVAKLKVHLFPSNQCRYVDYTEINGNAKKEIRFMVQNPKATSIFAKRAREGERITWAMPKAGGSYILIDMNSINEFRKEQSKMT